MIVGRSGEIRRLDQVLADVADGAGGTLLVVGAPGAGVTSLLATAARRASRHAHVVTARGVGGTVPGGLARDLARALGAAASDAESVLDAVARTCASDPLVLVVDDLHVADQQSQDLVAEVVAGARSRPEPIPLRFASWPRLELGPLDLESSLAVLRSVGPIDEDAARDLAGRLRGNPTALRVVPSLLDADVRAGRRPVPARIPVPDPISLPWLAVLPADDEARAALLEATLCQPSPPAAGPAALPPRSVAALARFPWIDDALRWSDPWLPDVITAAASEADTSAAHRALAAGAVTAGLPPSVIVVHLDLAASGVDDGIADALHEQAARRVARPVRRRAARVDGGGAAHRTRRPTHRTCGARRSRTAALRVRRHCEGRPRRAAGTRAAAARGRDGARRAAQRPPTGPALSLRVQGLVSDDVDAGIALLASALDAHTLGDDPFEHARTHLLRGERLRRARRRGDARRELGEAARLFGAMGAVPWVVRAESELRAAGGTPSGRAAPVRSEGLAAHGRPVLRCGPDVDGLTPQELAVATAVASGASNREVAEHLFLSLRTVEYHLGNVYRKLGVHGRGALGVRLRVDDGDS